MAQIYYGWWIVGVALVVNMLVIGTTFTAFGLYVLPVSEEFKLSRANMNTSLILLNFGSAGAAPLLGRLLDRAPARLILRGCAAALALGFVTLGLSRSVGLSAAAMALPLAIGVSGCGLTTTVLIARWFNAQRGRALALAVIGMSLSGIVVAPAVAFLIHAAGWRAALLISGVAVGGLLAALSLFVRERPGPGEHEGGKAAAAPPPAAAGPPAGMAEILRMPQFWSIALGVGLAIGVAQTLAVTFVPLALESGLTMVQATSLVSISGAAAIVSKLVLATVADRTNRVLLLTALFLAGALMNLALLTSEEYPLMVVCAGMLGVSSGVLTPVFYALLADRFGVASFGTVRGLVAPVAAILSALAVRFCGEVFDRTGGYDLVFASFIVVMLVAASLIFATRFTKPAGAAVPGPASASA